MSLLLEKYVGMYESLDAIKNLAGGDGGAYMLVGEDGDGLALMSRIVAAKLANVNVSVALGGHADIAVYPEDEDKPKSKKEGAKQKARAAQVTVDDVRGMLDSLYLTPFELDRRFYIIENADTMSEICQNKLLKSLEEPPPRVCFILCARRAMLPTVESRCKQIRLGQFSADEVRDALSKYHSDINAVELAARACRGSLGMAERILADRDFGATYAAALDIIRQSTGSKNFAHVAAVYEKFTRDKADDTLGLLEYLFADIARRLSGLDTVFAPSDLDVISAGLTPYAAARCADHVREAKRKNDNNCMIAAVMDELVLKIMEERSLCRR